MEKKKILLISTLGLSALTVFSVLVGTTSTKGFTKLLGEGEKVTWNHYSAVAPSFANKGIKEYWVSCSSRGHQFTAPTGDDVDVVDKGAPSQEFINSLETTDDRLLARIDDMTIDFEDDVYTHFISNVSGNTCVLSTEQAFNGTHSLKITTESSERIFRLSNDYYNRLPAEGVSFRMYSSDIFNAPIASGPSVYNAGHSVGNNINYWGDDQDIWRNYIVPKASIMATDDDHYIFKLPGGKTAYIDDIRPAYADTANVGFEDDRSLTKVLPYSGNTNTVTNEKAYSGEYSLKIVYGKNNRTFLLSDEFYNALPDEGVTFDVYSDGIFNGGQWHYFDPAGQWKEVTVTKSAINATAGDHYVGTLWADATFYIDNVRPANFLDDKTSTGFEEDYSTLLVATEGRNTATIVSGLSYSGLRSLKVVVTAANNKTFTLSDKFYNSLPEGSSIKFYVYADTAFNGGVWHYFSPLGEWKEITVAKSAINATAGDHYVGTFWGAGTFYIDNVLPVTDS